MADRDAERFSKDRHASGTPHVRPEMENIAHQLALRVSEQLPGIVEQLLQEGHDPSTIPWQLECSLTNTNHGAIQATRSRFPIATVNLTGDLSSLSPRASPFAGNHGTNNGITSVSSQLEHATHPLLLDSRSRSSTGDNTPIPSPARGNAGANKRRKTMKQQTSTISSTPGVGADHSTDVMKQQTGENLAPAQRRKKAFDNPVHKPSTLQKYITGVWESLYSGPKIDITEVVEQWQAIESDGQPKLLTDVEQEVTTRRGTGVCKCILSVVRVAHLPKQIPRVLLQALSYERRAKQADCFGKQARPTFANMVSQLDE